MSRKRKTIEVTAVKEAANTMLADSAADKAEGRAAIAVLLERVLLDTGNYRGFRYLEIKFDGDEVATFGDETRRSYY